MHYLSIFWRNIISYRNINIDVFSLYIPFNRRSRGFFLKTKEGTVRFLNAVNVVILIIFFCSFHNNTSVVWISKTVSIDTNYLLKLDTFLIHFDEGKETFLRSPKGDQRLPGKKKRKKSVVKSWEFIENVYFLFLVRGALSRAPILFPFIDHKYNDRKVNKYCFFSPKKW